jgi:hypothetical protein
VGTPACRITDETEHGGVIVMGFPTVLIRMLPAARIGDNYVCPMVTPECLLFHHGTRVPVFGFEGELSNVRCRLVYLRSVVSDLPMRPQVSVGNVMQRNKPKYLHRLRQSSREPALSSRVERYGPDSRILAAMDAVIKF